MEIARERHKALSWLSTPQHQAIFCAFSESVRSIELFGRAPVCEYPRNEHLRMPRAKSAKGPLEFALESGANSGFPNLDRVRSL